MPTSSSAPTEPENSNALRPVSTIEAPGTMTSSPRVCISIVASAFQYDCAPTLTPATMTSISPPDSVKVTMRRSTAAVQSRFSVPESMAMRAPDDSDTHSMGRPRASARSKAAMIRSALGTAEGSHRPNGVAGDPDAFGPLVTTGERVGDDADDDATAVPGRWSIDRTRGFRRHRGPTR